MSVTRSSSATPPSGAAPAGPVAGPSGEFDHSEAEDPLSSRSGELDDPRVASGPPGSAGLRIDLTLDADDADPPLEGWLEPHLARIAALAGVHEGQLSLAVVGDDAMASLHEQYKDVPGTTDVLTFDLRDDPDAPLEGDVVLCIDEAARQAARRGHQTRLEVLLYAVHGLLHLLGEDDADEAAAQRMHRREDELLTAAGFGPVFADRG